VKLSIPAIAGKPCFLRWQAARRVNGGQILRKHDAPFQLKCTRILTVRKIGNAAVLPIEPPTIAGVHGEDYKQIKAAMDLELTRRGKTPLADAYVTDPVRGIKVIKETAEKTF
jgi:hypothetical protein